MVLEKQKEAIVIHLIASLLPLVSVGIFSFYTIVGFLNHENSYTFRELTIFIGSFIVILALFVRYIVATILFFQRKKPWVRKYAIFYTIANLLMLGWLLLAFLVAESFSNNTTQYPLIFFMVFVLDVFALARFCRFNKLK